MTWLIVRTRASSKLTLLVGYILWTSAQLTTHTRICLHSRSATHAWLHQNGIKFDTSCLQFVICAHALIQPGTKLVVSTAPGDQWRHIQQISSAF